MERKYKQRGYMEDSSDAIKKERGKRPEKEKGIRHYGMRNGGTARSGIRCARCGKTMNLMGEIALDAKCESCSSDFHTCTNCAFFSTSSRWECTKAISARVAPKDTRNECTFFSPAVFVERTFESNATPQDARRAFEALFKK
jgi:hypothetical protein